MKKSSRAVRELFCVYTALLAKRMTKVYNKIINEERENKCK